MAMVPLSYLLGREETSSCSYPGAPYTDDYLIYYGSPPDCISHGSGVKVYNVTGTSDCKRERRCYLRTRLGGVEQRKAILVPDGQVNLDKNIEVSSLQGVLDYHCIRRSTIEELTSFCDVQG